MAQSLNKTVEFHTTGFLYLRWGRVGKILVGNAAFEFYADANVNTSNSLTKNQRTNRNNVSGRKISRHFEEIAKNQNCSSLLQRLW